MDTIPEELYQNIFGYLLGDHADDIFFVNKTYEIQLVNKNFQISFQNYLKTNPLKLNLDNDEDDRCDTVRLASALKSFGVLPCTLSLDIVSNSNIRNIIQVLHGFNFTSLRELSIIDTFEGDDVFEFHSVRGQRKNQKMLFEGLLGLNFSSLRHLIINRFREIDWGAFADCQKVTNLELHECYLDVSLQAQKLKTFLSSNKNTLEYIDMQIFSISDDDIFYDVLPKDMNWPNLKRLSIEFPSLSPEIIESSTLQEIVIGICDFPVRNFFIKCHHLKVLFIHNVGFGDFQLNAILELKDIPGYPYKTCNSIELRKIGLMVEVSDDCDIRVHVSE